MTSGVYIRTTKHKAKLLAAQKKRKGYWTREDILNLIYYRVVGYSVEEVARKINRPYYTTRLRIHILREQGYIIPNPKLPRTVHHKYNYPCPICGIPISRAFFLSEKVNRLCNKCYDKKYKNENKEKNSRRFKKHYQENKNKFREKRREYRKNNPQKRKELRKREKIRRKNNHTGGKVAEAEYKTLSTFCVYCFVTEDLTIDHIIPIDRGGWHIIENIISLCRSCNSSKGNKLLNEWLANKAATIEFWSYPRNL